MKILMSLLSVLFHLQNLQTVSQLFKILIFSQDIWGHVHYVPEINLIFKGILIKAIHILNKTI